MCSQELRQSIHWRGRRVRLSFRSPCVPRRPERCQPEVIPALHCWTCPWRLTSLLGWRCCKPRVLTFDEFLTIPPCTKGKHSTVEESPAAIELSKNVEEDAAEFNSIVGDKRDSPLLAQTSRVPRSLPAVGQSAPSSVPSESEEDDPALEVPAGKQCRRRGCCAIFSSELNREDENCIHHPGQPIFHEGSKGWSCCKKRVTDFDDFLNIPGCTSKARHMFMGRKKTNHVEQLRNVRWVSLYAYVTSFSVLQGLAYSFILPF